MSLNNYIKKSSAFTLVELVTTLMILGILFAVALPKFFDAQVYDALGFFDEFMNSVRYAQKAAIASHCDVKVIISSSSYSLYQEVTCGSGSFSTIVSGPSGDLSAAAPGGVSISGSTFYFDSAGAPVDASGGAYGDQTITSGSYSFKVHNNTGTVEKL
ncbi:MAG: type II secretion system protein [Thiotrichaceae bacterium]|nr:type II secretion system protein [Thiotrichaceae bacterium]